MGRQHHAAMHARRPYRHIRAVVEAAHKRALLSDTGADLGAGANAPGREDDPARRTLCRASRTRSPPDPKHGPGAILPIEPQQGALLRELVRSEVATDGREGLTQFRPVEPVASGAKRAEPL